LHYNNEIFGGDLDDFRLEGWFEDEEKANAM
jgi:hypothetical protein